MKNSRLNQNSYALKANLSENRTKIAAQATFEETVDPENRRAVGRACLSGVFYCVQRTSFPVVTLPSA